MALCPKIFLVVVVCSNCVPNVMLLSSNPQFGQNMSHICCTTFMYIIPMYLRLTTFTKPSSKCNFTYIWCYFYFILGLHHESADCWSAHRPQMHATASNMCTTDARHHQHQCLSSTSRTCLNFDEKYVESIFSFTGLSNGWRKGDRVVNREVS